MLIASFQIDREDRIVNISGDISPYCKLHGGSLLGFTPTMRVGSHWLDEVHGDSLRLYLRLLATAVRASAQPFCHTYCAEADGQLFEMEFQIAPMRHGRIAFDHFLRNVLPGTDECSYITTNTESHGLRCCTICARINEGFGWQARHRTLSAFPTIQAANGSPIPVVFTICWDCGENLTPKISALLGALPTAPEEQIA